ncbi:MAG: cell wall-binding repeat-containing protein [Clostridioides difficile]|nr:cell wall-binding repeat-containing protein [Clostridioides difficile]
MKFSKKFLTLGLATALLLGSSLSANAYSPAYLHRIEGSNNYETAAKIADKQNYSNAILVNLDNSIADGLSSSGLAGATNSAILLTKKDSIPDVTMTRLNKVKNVYIIGGTNSVSVGVENTLKSKGITVTRISGNDRNQTSLNVAKEVNKYSNSDYVFFANGFKGEADAISAAPIAAREKGIIILTDGYSTSYNARNKDCYVIGGKESMSENIVRATSGTRIGGQDRFETNKYLIQTYYWESGIVEDDSNSYYIADGYNLVGALVGAPLAKKSPIVLVSKQNVETSILSGADNIITLGKVDETAIDKAVDPFPVIGDMFGTWQNADDYTTYMRIEEDKFAWIWSNSGEELNRVYYKIKSVDKNKKSVVLERVGEDYKEYYRFTYINCNKFKLEYSTPYTGGWYEPDYYVSYTPW